jgi:hypothetical protein
LHPVVTTPTAAEPVKDGLQVTNPDVPDPLIVPAAVGVIDQTYPVALATALVVYVNDELPMQMAALPDGAFGEATLGPIVILLVATEVVPQLLVADTPIEAAPETPAGKVIELLAPVPATADPFTVQL